MHKNVVRPFVLVALVVLSVLLGAGCGSEPFQDDGHPVEKTGTLAAALQTTGSDGATYRFVAGTQLLINAVGPGVGGANFTVDGPETTFEKKLGVGNYVLGLWFGGATPHLLRITPTGTTTVEATWTDLPQPIPFTINANATTAITLHFNVPGFGNVTFSQGTLAVDIAVANETRAKPSTIVVNATVMGTFVTFNGVPGDATATAVANGTPLHMTLVISPKPTSNWVLDVTQACIDVDVTDTSAVEAALDTRLEQVEGGTGRVCIADGGANDYFWLQLSKDGTMPPSQQATYPGTYGRYVDLGGGNIGDVFDGTTLNQALLGQGVSIASAAFSNTVIDSVTGQVVTRLDGTVTTGTLTAQP
jgi:hypothetical protein